MRALLGLALLAVTLAGCTSAPPPSTSTSTDGGASSPPATTDSGAIQVQVIGGESGNVSSRTR